MFCRWPRTYAFSRVARINGPALTVRVRVRVSALRNRFRACPYYRRRCSRVQGGAGVLDRFGYCCCCILFSERAPGGGRERPALADWCMNTRTRTEREKRVIECTKVNLWVTVFVFARCRKQTHVHDFAPMWVPALFGPWVPWLTAKDKDFLTGWKTDGLTWRIKTVRSVWLNYFGGEIGLERVNFASFNHTCMRDGYGAR